MSSANMETLLDYFALGVSCGRKTCLMLSIAQCFDDYIYAKQNFQSRERIYFLERLINDEPILELAKIYILMSPLCNCYLQKMSSAINCGNVLCALTVEHL